jgi:hypothetical protein
MAADWRKPVKLHPTRKNTPALCATTHARDRYDGHVHVLVMDHLRYLSPHYDRVRSMSRVQLLDAC